MEPGTGTIVEGTGDAAPKRLVCHHAALCHGTGHICKVQEYVLGHPVVPGHLLWPQCVLPADPGSVTHASGESVAPPDHLQHALYLLRDGVECTWSITVYTNSVCLHIPGDIAGVGEERMVQTPGDKLKDNPCERLRQRPICLSATVG